MDEVTNNKIQLLLSIFMLLSSSLCGQISGRDYALAMAHNEHSFQYRLYNEAEGREYASFYK